jgi:hypothetical protein
VVDWDLSLLEHILKFILGTGSFLQPKLQMTCGETLTDLLLLLIKHILKAYQQSFSTLSSEFENFDTLLNNNNNNRPAKKKQKLKSSANADYSPPSASVDMDTLVSMLRLSLSILETFIRTLNPSLWLVSSVEKLCSLESTLFQLVNQSHVFVFSLSNSKANRATLQWLMESADAAFQCLLELCISNTFTMSRWLPLLIPMACQLNQSRSSSITDEETKSRLQGLFSKIEAMLHPRRALSLPFRPEYHSLNIQRERGESSTRNTLPMGSSSSPFSFVLDTKALINAFTIDQQNDKSLFPQPPMLTEQETFYPDFASTDRKDGSDNAREGANADKISIASVNHLSETFLDPEFNPSDLQSSLSLDAKEHESDHLIRLNEVDTEDGYEMVTHHIMSASIKGEDSDSISIHIIDSEPDSDTQAS